MRVDEYKVFAAPRSRSGVAGAPDPRMALANKTRSSPGTPESSQEIATPVGRSVVNDDNFNLIPVILSESR